MRDVKDPRYTINFPASVKLEHVYAPPLSGHKASEPDGSGSGSGSDASQVSLFPPPPGRSSGRGGSAGARGAGAAEGKPSQGEGQAKPPQPLFSHTPRHPVVEGQAAEDHLKGLIAEIVEEHGGNIVPMGIVGSPSSSTFSSSLMPPSTRREATAGGQESKGEVSALPQGPPPTKPQPEQQAKATAEGRQRPGRAAASRKAALSRSKAPSWMVSPRALNKKEGGTKAKKADSPAAAVASQSAGGAAPTQRQSKPKRTTAIIDVAAGGKATQPVTTSGTATPQDSHSSLLARSSFQLKDRSISSTTGPSPATSASQASSPQPAAEVSPLSHPVPHKPEKETKKRETLLEGTVDKIPSAPSTSSPPPVRPPSASPSGSAAKEKAAAPPSKPQPKPTVARKAQGAASEEGTIMQAFAADAPMEEVVKAARSLRQETKGDEEEQVQEGDKEGTEEGGVEEDTKRSSGGTSLVFGSAMTIWADGGDTEGLSYGAFDDAASAAQALLNLDIEDRYIRLQNALMDWLPPSFPTTMRRVAQRWQPTALPAHGVDGDTQQSPTTAPASATKPSGHKEVYGKDVPQAGDVHPSLSILLMKLATGVKHASNQGIGIAQHHLTVEAIADLGAHFDVENRAPDLKTKEVRVICCYLAARNAPC